MTATPIEDPDQCYVRRRNPATSYGMCESCFGRAVWYLDPTPWSDER